MERFTFENWELKSFGNPQNRGRVWLWNEGACVHLDSWIIFLKDSWILGFKRNLGSKKRFKDRESDQWRFARLSLPPKNSHLKSFQKHLFSGFHWGSKTWALGPPTREAATVRFKALAAHTVHLELRMLIFDEFFPTQMVRFPNKQNSDFKNYV